MPREEGAREREWLLTCMSESGSERQEEARLVGRFRAGEWLRERELKYYFTLVT